MDWNPKVSLSGATPTSAAIERLRHAGKLPKVALTACMRKLLTILNTMLKHQTRWAVAHSSAP